ncbi:unnamed protein product [Meganyctiphanes norvegica]|uniref:Protein sleepless n=1 Tax=Meganyctiphanes norvegica TaxID=48144 RepID=A0AAV2R6D3_MEGNR
MRRAAPILQTASWLLLLSLVASTCALKCYYCNDYDDFGTEYDPLCGVPDYYNQSPDHIIEGAVCETIIFDDGKILRTDNINGYDGAECDTISDSITCYCFEDFCNDQLCKQCGTP